MERLSQVSNRRLSNDLNVVHDPGLNQFIMIEGMATAHRVLLDTVDRLPYVG